MYNHKNHSQEPIAIIGASCRLPGGVNSLEKLRELLRQPPDLSANIPLSRFNADTFYHPKAGHAGTSNIKKAYLLEEDVLAFDNDFFNISVREAESMDPQQRNLLEIIYEAIEASGYTISQLKGSSTGVFVGQMTDDYRDLLLRDPDYHPTHTGTGVARSILANRVSYAFDWKGPSMNIDTACSSSPVALHQAVQSLRQGDCEMAVVAGVNLVFGPETFSQFSSLGMLSTIGKCHMWDNRADGYARGDGFAAIVIKMLSSAVAHNDDIETIVKSTGINQDGHSSGLTVPSAESQAELIRNTYQRCGLDCLKDEDRCQYFEAHGTGTQAGDPKEAQAISMAFFPETEEPEHHVDQRERSCNKETKLYVGSVKTVMGHTEGAAGLVSLLKASIAVKHGLIMPNLHFKRLNPSIELYYKNLEIPTSPQSWPQLPDDVPRRASVNSFGFGGANAHAIIESWDNNDSTQRTRQTCSRSPVWGPFVLSAHSRSGLRSMAISLSEKLKQQDSVDLSRLAWTLQTHRTKLKYRISVSATDREKLVKRLDETITSIDELQTPNNLSTGSQMRVLGIFTGQGAQWASMGRSLYQNSVLFRSTFLELASILRGLPEGPTWCLADKLLHWDDPADQLPAETAQPICTAIQIALVELLRAWGISFTAVVGHSSEWSGKMMAVGMAAHDARQFCQRQPFAGKLVVAAENSTSSTTLSEDTDAIQGAKRTLDGEKVFSRILKTDMAYHSHHMARVKDPYCLSMQEARIKPKRKACRGACSWYSTVYPSTSIDGNPLSQDTCFDGSYWADNLKKPVLFSQGIIAALQEHTFDLVLEIGPHAALKAPATETIRGVLGDPLPYVGALERGKDALETFSNVLGALWCHADSQTAAVNFAGLRKACDGVTWTEPPVLKQLPSYPWDHERSMIRESRKSYLWRTREPGRHELLGNPVSWGDNEWRWRNVLRLDDIDWLQCHQFQSQPLLPASAYIVAAVEAAIRSVGTNSRSVQMIELQDVIIHNGVALDADSLGVDLEFSMSKMEEDEASVTFDFSCRCSDVDSASFNIHKKVATGRIFMLRGADDEYLLPERTAPKLPLKAITLDRFYSWMDRIGLHHDVICPATLDSVLQGLYAAFSYPGDGQISISYLPKSFRRIRLDVSTCCRISSQPGSDLIADCYVTESSPREISGDIDVFCLADARPVVQIQGVVLLSLETPSATKDPTLIWQTVWMKDMLSIASSNQDHNQAKASAVEAYEKTAHLLLSQLLRKINHQDIEATSWYLSHLLMLASTLDHSMNRPCYTLGDRHQQQQETLISIGFGERNEAFNQIDLVFLQQIEPRVLSILEEPKLQHTAETDKMVSRIRTEGLGAVEVNNHLGTVIDHLVHRYPAMRILELSSGAGEYTALHLQHLESDFTEYVFADSTDVGFSAARARFAAHHPSLAFRILDIGQSPVSQGFEANSYDLVIATHALSLLRSVDDALQHCRQLLRPGGYLVILEMTNPAALRNIFQLPFLPDWRSNQKHSPIFTEAQWDAKLRGTSFSGVDVALRDFKADTAHGMSIMVTQTVDDQIIALREPLAANNDTINTIEKLVIVGSRTLEGMQMAHRLMTLLRPFAKALVVIKDLSDALDIVWKPETAVISICDTEDPTFRHMNEGKIAGMQTLFREARYILWATRSGYCDDPFGAISIGIGRTAARELPHLRVKFVDLESHGTRTRCAGANMLAEMLLRMILIDHVDATSILWSNETEVSVREGALLIPRVRQNRILNSHSSRPGRHTTTSQFDVLPSSLPIESGTSLAGPSPDQLYKIVSSSVVKFKCPELEEPFHIGIVTRGNENKHRLYLWPSRDGLIDIDSWPQDIDPDELLPLILLIIVCESALSDCTGTVWIHNANPQMCETLSLVANRTSTQVFLTTHDTAAKTSPASTKAMFIHPRATFRSLNLLIPRSIRRFVNMDAIAGTASSAVDFALNFLNQELDFRSGFQKISALEPFSLHIAKSKLSSILSQYFTEPTILQSLWPPERHVILRPDQLLDDQNASAATSVISWSGGKSVSIMPVSPASKDQIYYLNKPYNIY
ncbi:hypothetical protein F4679DRAFT_599942 [Xylaria curta]|nr:hypothetical protein F4679DRAFT_599942 [Xylaria curta]